MADNGKLTCPICGEPTRVWYGNARKDGLCGKHADMLKAGEIEMNDRGLWIDAARKTLNPTKAELPKVATKEPAENESTCIVCGKTSNGKPQCRSCYGEAVDFMDSLDRNGTVRKFRDYYYNLKERILIIKSLEEAQKQCNKLIAIAMASTNIHDDTSLFDRVYKDVEVLLKSKKAPIANDKYEEERKENDEHKSKVNTAQDGHVVDSDMEVRIDDILYTSFILHACGKSITEITEKRKKCDWFIPIINGKGIYIEYWGMKTSKYLEERKEKEELYQKHNIPYIGIEADDPKKDTLTFASNLKQEIIRLAERHYKYVPEWLK